MNRFCLTIALLLLALPTLSACVTDPYARLALIRAEKLPIVEEEIIASNLQPGAPTFIRIFKEEAELEIWLQDAQSKRYAHFKTYPICNYSGRLGPKLREGDHQSPEGFYDVTEDWMWPESKYHLAMNIGFPNEYDESHARTGSHLMIHGDCHSVGCYAMTDAGIEEIYVLVEQSLLAGNDNVPIHIFPFRMDGINLEAHRGNRWMRFWINLKRGYDVFEQTRVPPVIGVDDGIYVFNDPGMRYRVVDSGV